MNVSILRLSNGLRVLHVSDLSLATVHCGYLINAGSRDENSAENGLAHLIEHCLFKGTEKRKAYHILTRLDAVGGELNAYTTKEETCVYASALKEHFDRSAELLTDIVFHSRFPEKEIAKEITVIKDEINSYLDNPEELLVDEFEERLFPNHPLGKPILGSEKVVEGLNQRSIQSFTDTYYSTDQMVFAVVGNVSLKKVERFCNKVLDQIPASRSKRDLRVRPKAEQFVLDRKQTVHQVHTMIGAETIGLDDDRRRGMFLLNNILGGPALNSRLNLNIRERLGYCYYIESNYVPYTDCGLFQVYFGTDQRYSRRVQTLVAKELKQLMDTPLKERALTISKKQLLAQLALSQENKVNQMLSLGKTLLHFDRVDSFEVMQEDVMSITAVELQELASSELNPEHMSRLSFISEI